MIGSFTIKDKGMNSNGMVDVVNWHHLSFDRIFQNYTTYRIWKERNFAYWNADPWNNPLANSIE